MSATPLRELDPDVVGALEHCRVRSNWNATPDGFQKAKAMGLLAQDPVWRTTERGEGVLIAAGLLPPRPEPEQLAVHILWGDPGEPYQPVPIAAFSDGLVDAFDEEYQRQREAAEDHHRRAFDWPASLRFYTAVVHLDRPTPPTEDGDE